MPSYEKREDGHWSVRFRITDENGKPTMKRLSGFDKKIKAESAYREFIGEYERSAEKRKSPLKEMTFSELLNNYLENKKSRVKPSSLYDMTNIINARITPYFGNMLISEITPQNVLNWQNQLEEKGLSYKYKSSLRTYLSGIFKFACQLYDLKTNPVSKVDAFRNLEQKKEMQIWTFEEFNKFTSVVESPMYLAFFYCLYFGGFRKGELLAITWNDIDFDKKTMSISKSLTRKVEGKPYAITTPKNASSNRILKMPQVCIDRLHSLKTTSNSPTSFVFGDTKPIAENTLSRYFAQWCNIAGVKIIRIHDFRHSHASLLIHHNENVLMISKRLGHTDITQTLNTYSHLMPDKENELVDKLNKLTKNIL